MSLELLREGHRRALQAADGLTAAIGLVKQDETAQAVALLRRLWPVLDQPDNVEELQRLLLHIVYLLQGHIHKEETTYFPLAEKRLSKQQLQALDEEMESIAHL